MELFPIGPRRPSFPMKVQYLIWAFTIGVTLLAAIVDFRTHRIPNWLTVPAFFLGLGLRTAISGLGRG